MRDDDTPSGHVIVSCIVAVPLHVAFAFTVLPPGALTVNDVTG